MLSFTEALQDDEIKEVIIENGIVNGKLDGLRAEKSFSETPFYGCLFQTYGMYGCPV